MPEPKLSIVPCGDYTPETVRAALLAPVKEGGGRLRGGAVVKGQRDTAPRLRRS